MIGNKNKREIGGRLDRLGRALVRASAAREEEAEALASSPFLYARLRSRIAAERQRRAEEEGWLALLGVAWRSAPAMALVAVFAFVLFWSAGPGAGASLPLSDDALLGARNTGIEHVVFADRSALSNDEVLATILNADEREATR